MHKPESTIRSTMSRTLTYAQHLLLVVLAGLTAFLLRFDFHVPAFYQPHLIVALAVWVAVKMICFEFGNLSRTALRHASTPDFVAIVAVNFIATVIAIPVILVSAPEGFPRSIYLIDFVLCTQLLFAAQIAFRLGAERGPEVSEERTLIYGAGCCGAMLLREIRMNPKLAYKIVGFVDDDISKRGLLLQRVRIVGTGPDLPHLVKRLRVAQVLVAIPSATSHQMISIFEVCRNANVQCKTVPALAEMVDSADRKIRVRNFEVEDLLGRSPVELDQESIRGSIASRVVLVTGAAGSIGSELCRQLTRFEPAHIVGFESAETPLFHLERELLARFPRIPFSAEVGSIQNRKRFADVLEKHRPAIIFHAAAYKHVPMMEKNLFEAVENNIFGTFNVAEAAERAGVENFVMISSDKAVHPTNIMGTTKRCAELLIRQMNGRSTKFVSVRFGNVLGSNGSVLPIFKSQIADGGPVTVTHPEMRRFFMTIPEAAQLVIQASTMGNGGEIFVLDMGDPVKIVDLARKAIELSGLCPEKDIQIQFTGIRPGEKLYEELNLDDEEVLGTYHPKIKIFRGPQSSVDIAAQLEDLRECCRIRDEQRALAILQRIVPDYLPGTHLLPVRKGFRVVKSGCEQPPRFNQRSVS